MSFAQEMRDFIGAYKAMSSGGPSEAERRRKAQEMPESFVDQHIAESRAKTSTRSDTTAIPVDTGAAAPETEGGTALPPEERETPAYASGGVVQDELTVPTSAGAAQVQAIPEERLAFEGGGIAHQDYFDRLETERGTGRRKPLLSPQDLGDALDLFVKGLSQAGNDGALPVDDGGQGFAAAMMGKGAATPQEVKAMDSVLDPRGRMSPDERAEFRLGAMVKWKLQQGDYRGAMEVAKALSLYSVMESQRYAGMARAAVAAGDDKGAAYYAMKAGQALPDGKRHVVQPMGNGKFRVASVDGYTGKTAPPMTLDRAGMAKMTEAGMVGGIPLKALMTTAAAHRTGDPMGRARRRSSGGSGRGGSGRATKATSGAPANDAPVIAAKSAYDAAVEEGDEAKIAAAKANLDAAVNTFRSAPYTAKNQIWEKSLRDQTLARLGVGGAAPTAGGKAGAKGVAPDLLKEGAQRSAPARAAINADVPNSLANTDVSVRNQPVGPSGRMAEAADVARTAGVEKSRALSRGVAGAAYDAQKLDTNNKDFETRRASIPGKIDAVLNEGPEGKSGDATTSGRIPLGDKEKEKVADVVTRVLDKNPQMSPEVATRAVTEMMYGNDFKYEGKLPIKILPNGKVSIDGQSFYMGEDDLALTTAERGRVYRQRVSENTQNINAGAQVKRRQEAGIAEDNRDKQSQKRWMEANPDQYGRRPVQGPPMGPDPMSGEVQGPPMGPEPETQGPPVSPREEMARAVAGPYDYPTRNRSSAIPPEVQGPPMDDRIDGPRNTRARPPSAIDDYYDGEDGIRVAAGGARGWRGGEADKPSSPGGARNWRNDPQRDRRDPRQAEWGIDDSYNGDDGLDLASGGARGWRDPPEESEPNFRAAGGTRDWDGPDRGGQDRRSPDYMARDIRDAEADAPAEPEERYLLDDLNFYTGAGI
jgi:hypothetical protein